MQGDISALRYLPAHQVAHASTSLGGFDVRDTAGETLGILDGFVIDASIRRVSHFVVEGRGWATRRRYVIPIGQALVNSSARSLHLDVRGCKQFPGFDPARYPAFSEDELFAYSESVHAV